MGHGTTTEVWRVRLAEIGGASDHEWGMVQWKVRGGLAKVRCVAVGGP